MTIAVKYCGGCNPRYDRMEIARRLRRDFPKAELTGPGGGAPDFVAVICGCHSRCAGHESLRGRFGKAVLAAPEDYEALYQLIAKTVRS